MAAMRVSTGSRFLDQAGRDSARGIYGFHQILNRSLTGLLHSIANVEGICRICNEPMDETAFVADHGHY